jgi:hypothetical protein
MRAFVSESQFQIFVRGLLRLLDEPVQKHHPALLVDIKARSGDAVSPEVAPHLI